VAATIVKVVGIFESGVNELDRGALFLPLEFFQESFTMEGAAHSIVIRTHSLVDVAALQSALALPVGIKAYRWDELVPGVKEAISLDLAAGWLFYFSLILIVTFGITNTMLMSVVERRKEFGTLLALGAPPRTVFRIVLLESALLTALGILLGVVIGVSLLLYFSAAGFTIPGSEAVMKLWNLPNKIYPQLTVRVVTDGPKILLITSVLAALYPALQAARLNPLKALQGR
jgi:ABC-type lipoprotein release transport system permease subunit